ncbi:MAG: VWA domain-containing protein [Desulfatibacillum sp.]|nr:VWA domain-containing protein [Desulfatibacillum sp.]
MRNGLKFYVLFVIMTFLIPLPGIASGKTQLVLIFDGSGSMWGQINGVAKITIAKNAMGEIVQGLPDDINLGLVAYGHRQKGDCDDVEFLIPLDKIDKQGVIKTVQAINPKGKTPIVRSVRMTAEAIKHLEDETTIILVSDGEETCDPEPCAFVQELKALGIKFVMHVVGFDVGGATEEQLKCMAQAGGGEYFPASDADNLKSALNSVVKKAVGQNLKVSATRNGKVLPVDVFVLEPQTGKVLANRPSTEKQPAGFGLEPGVYDIKAVDAWSQEGAPEHYLRGVEVVETEIREVAMEFGGGTLEVRVVNNGDPYNADVRVTDSGGKDVFKQTGDTGMAKFELEGGQYHLSVKDEWGTGAVIDLGMVSIGPEIVAKQADFTSGAIHAWAFRQGKPYVADVYVIDSTGRQVDNMTTREDQAVMFPVLPGQYTVRVKDEWGDGSIREFSATVEGGKTVEIKVDYDQP